MPDLAVPARPPRARPAVLLVAVLTTTALALGLLALRADAAGTAASVVVEGNLGLDGVLRVRQTVTYADAPPAQLQQRFELREDLVGDRQYVTELSGFAATAGGAAVTPAVADDDRFTTVTVPTNGASEVVLDYTVTGAVVTKPDATGTALRWQMLQGLDAPVRQFTATVEVPTVVTYVRCTAGSPNSIVPCATATGGLEGGMAPTFTDGPRGAGEVVGVDIGFPPGTVRATEQIDYRWTLGRAFSARPLPLALALGLLVLGGVGLWLAHRRIGRDVDTGGGADQVARVGEFVPVGPGQSEFRVVDEIRPGHVGTVADERVDPIDVTATLVDLAVRGHLLITELPREGEFARTDWELSRPRRPAGELANPTTAGGDELRPFEAALLDGIVGQDGRVRVSQLGGRVQQTIPAVQDALYDEVVRNGWFDHRPDATRNRWTRLAVAGLVAAVVVTVLLAAFTTFGLVGLAVVVLTLGLLFLAQEMPSRTTRGVALLNGLGLLRSDLHNHPTDQLPPGAVLREVSELLPYAIVLGGTERWLDALVASDSDVDPDATDLSWYHGPPTWHLRDLPDSIRNFTTTVSGTLFTR